MPACVDTGLHSRWRPISSVPPQLPLPRRCTFVQWNRACQADVHQIAYLPLFYCAEDDGRALVALGFVGELHQCRQMWVPATQREQRTACRRRLCSAALLLLRCCADMATVAALVPRCIDTPALPVSLVAVQPGWRSCSGSWRLWPKTSWSPRWRWVLRCAVPCRDVPCCAGLWVLPCVAVRHTTVQWGCSGLL